MSNATTHDRDDQDAERKPQTDEPTTKDGTDDDVPAPFAPDSDDDSALGDTDEHSDA
jgi:hypothetical protein